MTKWALTLVLLLIAMPLHAAQAEGHDSTVAAVALSIAIILAAAKVGGELATRLRQPAVLGELLVGVLLGNLTLAGVSGLEHIKSDPSIDLLAGLGVLVLLFEVGLESTVAQMLQVGASALAVAVLGVLGPFALGWLLGAWLLPGSSVYVHAFLGATLSATSVGISVRVLKDLNYSQTAEARVILGAAVIDDVLGLIILAAVTGAILSADRGESLSYAHIAWIFGKATVFLVGSLALGTLFAPRVFSLVSRLRGHGVLLATGLVFCFLFSWLADRVGLAAIVGAFAAGLILEPSHYAAFVRRGERTIEDLIHPISSFLVPLFFVLMGMRTDLRSLAQPGVLTLAAALTLAAIAGKQLCSLGVIGARIDRLSVGIGMIPRGEVGLIFANVGLGLSLGGHRLIDESTFAAIVVMVIVTTVITPPSLAWSLRRSRPSATADSPSA
jgi:Kef-type K+ transport system membrane component KefB